MGSMIPYKSPFKIIRYTEVKTTNPEISLFGWDIILPLPSWTINFLKKTRIIKQTITKGGKREFTFNRPDNSSKMFFIAKVPVLRLQKPPLYKRSQAEWVKDFIKIKVNGTIVDEGGYTFKREEKLITVTVEFGGVSDPFIANAPWFSPGATVECFLTTKTQNDIISDILRLFETTYEKKGRINGDIMDKSGKSLDLIFKELEEQKKQRKSKNIVSGCSSE